MTQKAEYIPNKSKLYRWVINFHIVGGKINQAAFSLKNRQKDLSMEWSDLVKDPEETRYRMTNYPKPTIRWSKDFAKKHGVISLITKDVRLLQLEVRHTPSDWNPAHTSIFNLYGLEKYEALDKRRQLARMSQLELEPIKK